MSIGITAFSTQQREGWGQGLTGLAVRAGQLRAGVSQAAPPGTTAAGFTMSASTKALAAAVADVEQLANRPSPDDPTKAERLAGLDNRRMVAEIMEGNIDSQRRNDNNVREIVKRFDETGVAWEPDANGALRQVSARQTYDKHGGVAGYMNALRARIPGMDERLLGQMEDAKRWRDGYEESRRDILEGR